MLPHYCKPLGVSELTLRNPQSQQFDGGNDNFQNKYFSIMIHVFEEKLSKVITGFVNAPVCNIATGETLH